MRHNPLFFNLDKLKTKMDLEKLIESNAKAIAVLTSSDIQEMKRDRDTMYGLMRDLTEKMSQLTSHQPRNTSRLREIRKIGVVGEIG